MSTEASAEKLQESSEVKIAQDAIKKHGNNAEHNIFYFLNNEEQGTKNTIIDFGKDEVILANFEEDNNVWNVFPSGIISSEDRKILLFEKFCKYCLNGKKSNEVYGELDFEIYKKVKQSFKNWIVSDIQFEYTWPIVDLKNFDRDLKSSKYYELRKIKTSFLKENNFEIKEVNEVLLDDIKIILKEWEKNRTSGDKAHLTEYGNWVKTKFNGCDYAKCWIVNKNPCAIVAGWRIPNSGSFYLAIVLHNYTVKSLGEMIYLKTLLELKELGYESCNLGGSDQKLLNFKKKFLPTTYYKTVEFYVRRK